MTKMTDFYGNSYFRKYNRKWFYLPHIIFWISCISSCNVKIVSCITYYLYDMYIYIT